MITRMEKVAQDVVLTAARKAGTAPQSALDQQTFKAAFQAAWPIPDSARPMNDAINTAAQAASNCTTQDSDTWKTTLNQFWHPAVREIVDEYLTAARHSFRKGESLEGSEILTDAVRTTLVLQRRVQGGGSILPSQRAERRLSWERRARSLRSCVSSSHNSN